jgi:hypothetical protein
MAFGGAKLGIIGGDCSQQALPGAKAAAGCAHSEKPKLGWILVAICAYLSDERKKNPPG